MINEVFLLGRVGQDAECKESNRPVTFSMATSENFKDEDSDSGWRTETTWHNIVVWGTAESKKSLLDRVKKGHMVAVKGKIDHNKWEDEEGNKRSFARVIARYVKVLPRDVGGGASEGGEDKPKASSKPKDEAAPPAEDDDLPF